MGNFLLVSLLNLTKKGYPQKKTHQCCLKVADAFGRETKMKSTLKHTQQMQTMVAWSYFGTLTSTFAGSYFSGGSLLQFIAHEPFFVCLPMKTLT